MEQKPLPTVSCKSCNLLQCYRGQQNCIHCGRRLSDWHVASQLRIQAEKAVQQKRFLN